MKSTFAAAALLAGTSVAALAAPERYVLDPGHSQIVFNYDHLGYSTGYGMFSGFEGEIMFDEEDPANSTVSVSFPVRSMLTGWEQRYQHFMSDDFFGAEEADMVTFESTSIEVTDEDRAEITGDLTLNGQTQVVVLEAQLNQVGQHPMEGAEWAGFDATTTLNRSDYGLGMFAPAISDEVAVTISIEARKAAGTDS